MKTERSPLPEKGRTGTN